MSAEDKHEHDFEAIEEIADLRHLSIEALHSFVSQLRYPADRFSGLKGLSPEVKSDLIMFWEEALSNLVGEMVDRREIDDDTNRLEDLTTVLPLVDDQDVADMIVEIDGYNVFMIDAFAAGVDRRPELN
jgi:hypothetical protein